MSVNTIQTGAHQHNAANLQKYSLMMGGLNVTHDVLKQYDPLVTGYGRLFMVRKPLTMATLFKDDEKFNNFKHILEYGFTSINGLNDVSVNFATIQGGYANKSFEVPNTIDDATNSFTVGVYEFSGSPVREILHTWINTTIDKDSGLSHYGGLIASGQMEYNQANHTAEFIYVVTDRTGMKVEYACMFANCFPRGYKNSQFNTESGEHNIVETDIEFSCTKYESVDINKKAKELLKNYQILVNSIEFNSGLNFMEGKDKSLFDANGSFDEQARMYDSATGELTNYSANKFFVDPSESNKANVQSHYNADGSKVTPSYTVLGNS